MQFEILEPARSSLLAWLARRRGSLENYAFPSRIDRLGYLSTRQYARLLEEWVSGIGLRKGTTVLILCGGSADLQSDRQLASGADLARAREDETTVRYLGVEVEDARTLADAAEV